MRDLSHQPRRGRSDCRFAFRRPLHSRAIKADIGRSLRRNKPLLSNLDARDIAGFIEAAGFYQEKLNGDLDSLKVDGTSGDALIVAKWNLYTNYGAKIAPSAIASEVATLTKQKNDLDRRKKEAKVLELDRTAPARPKADLILAATEKYLTENCNRAVLAMRASTGGGGLSVLTARSVEAKRGMCVINSATHLLSFNIRSVKRHQCTIGNPAACTFTGNWACRYELNPEFGFSNNTRNLDVICPLVRSSPINFKGVFQRKAPRRWIANTIDWE